MPACSCGGHDVQFPGRLNVTATSADVVNTFRDSKGQSIADVYRFPGSSFAFGVPLFAAGVYGSLRTASWRGGVLAAIGTYAFTWFFMSLWFNVTLYPFAQYQQVNPYWIQAWHYSDAPGETFLHWIFWDNVGALIIFSMVMCAISSICGVVGSTVSWTYRRLVAR